MKEESVKKVLLFVGSFFILVLLIFVAFNLFFKESSDKEESSLKEFFSREKVYLSNESFQEVYEKYCFPESEIDLDLKVGPIMNESFATDSFFVSLANLSTEELKNNLLNGNYSLIEEPQVLYSFGEEISKEGNIGDGILIYECLAKHYYNRLAMYRLLGLNYLGVKDANILANLSEAYFWVYSIIFSEMEENTGIIDLDYGLGWNIIASLDSLDIKLSESERLKQAERAEEFIKIKYPKLKTTSK